jgi:predicted DNA-binding protein
VQTPHPHHNHKKPGAPMAKTGRLEIRVEAEWLEKLENLAKWNGTSKADIIDRAVGLYEKEYEKSLSKQSN